jgi:hypothetical protein
MAALGQSKAAILFQASRCDRLIQRCTSFKFSYFLFKSSM